MKIYVKMIVIIKVSVLLIINVGHVFVNHHIHQNIVMTV